MSQRRTLLSWSSGKDSAWALHLLRQQGDAPAALLTTFNEAAGRAAMHGVRRELVRAQAAAAGLPLWEIPLPWPCSGAEYERRMADACRRAIAEGFDSVAFGDLFLADIREYRERQMEGTGLTPVFPLWQRPTGSLANEMIAGGLRARLTCVDRKRLDRSFAGREFDGALLNALPEGIDPCGENGEFHTFVYGGPMFRGAIAIEAGEIREIDGFAYADLKTAPQS